MNGNDSYGYSLSIFLPIYDDRIVRIVFILLREFLGSLSSHLLTTDNKDRSRLVAPTHIIEEEDE